MAFMLGAALGGAAKRGSEIIKEEREAAYDLIDTNIRDWTRLGVPKINERKKLRTKMEQASDFLSRRGFSNDQIAVALYQDDYENVVNHIKRLEMLSADNPQLAEYKPSDIINMGPDYTESGQTMSQILDGVMGKVRSGMNTSDAIADMGGGGLQSMFMQQRAKAAAAASGVDIATMRAMATDDLEYGTSPEGIISIVDPIESAKVKAALSGGETGMPGINAATSILRSDLSEAVPGFVAAGFDRNLGREMYKHETDAINAEINRFVRKAVAAKSTEVSRQRFSAVEMNEIFEAGMEHLMDKGYIERPTTTDTTDNGDQEAATVPVLTQTDDANLMLAEAQDIIPTLDAGQVDAFMSSAYDQVFKYYQGQTANDSQARQKANEWEMKLLGNVAGASGRKRGSAYHQKMYPHLYDEEGYLIEQE